MQNTSTKSSESSARPDSSPIRYIEDEIAELQKAGQIPNSGPMVAIIPPKTLCNETSGASKTTPDAKETTGGCHFKNESPVQSPESANKENESHIACPTLEAHSPQQTCKAAEDGPHATKQIEPSYDVVTPQGRAQWKAHISASLLKKTRVPLNGRLRYCDLARYDKKNCKYRRVFVPGRGWVANNGLDQEIQIYGLLGLVREAPTEQSDLKPPFRSDGTASELHVIVPNKDRVRSLRGLQAEKNQVVVQ